MFLQIGNTFINQERLEYVTIYVECLRQKLFENLSIHNIKIDLDTGEIIC